jgi:hypothetical protein
MFEALGRDSEQRTRQLIDLQWFPTFDPYRADPRFQAPCSGE